ncbi:hypothetical protein EJF36_19180 [Bacillus sp. HMF5848]|uniref:hypothetical protein n=1 Tax=Bacillus sp. HMF5848 TaxID=2495421 RepID=UPI000F786D1E|nr:hypothetical protein [Bacillus sp. HMF5848]RSK28827.1 hypothetical protein EJF36_19180 [Bacillus sp. HMF5848]
MVRKYNLDPGYITVPEANQIVLRVLRIVNKNDKSHYNKILAGAKKGLYGGKKYGSRMYQVRKEDIIEYAEKQLQNEQLQLFDIKVTTSLEEHDNIVQAIDPTTAKNLYIYLRHLLFHKVISEAIFHECERKIVIRSKLEKIQI